MSPSRVQVMVPPEPAAGVMQFQTSGATAETNVMLAGTVSVKVVGPVDPVLLLTVTRYVTSEFAATKLDSVVLVTAIS